MSSAVGQSVSSRVPRISTRAVRRSVDAPEELEQGGLAAAGGPHDGDVLARVDAEETPPERVHRLAVHRIVLAQVAGDRSSGAAKAHVASARSVAAMGARDASQAG